MKKLILALCFLPFSAGMAAAGDFDNFNNNASQTLLKPFAKDLGGLLGAMDFNSGRSLGFPGFDVNATAVVQSKPSSDNAILNLANVGAFGVAMLQASAGLPLTDLDVAVRGVSYGGLSIMGAGVRYGIFKSGLATKFIPDISVGAFYDVIDFDYFKGSHLSFSAAASFDLPIIKPYAVVGIDRTTVEAQNNTVTPAVNGVDATVTKPRYTLGVRLSPLPLVYVYGAYNILHGEGGYTAGLGVRF
ncbi:MAG: hypothetical protein FD189_1811 [Elusimicrobia bacterium]|nr:MAG: hypothetical protein FD154_1954 [Elusimicrobiota bacterium]KAF0154559.1 MAG: hypothetical protein FD189_1811 [Elusimicrobiota bacterium]